MRIAVESRVADLSPEERSLLLERLPDEARSTRETVTGIIERVRTEGDRALLAMARELDGVELTSIEVPRAAWRAALEELEQDLVEALVLARDNIARFHAAQIPAEVTFELEAGGRLLWRTIPLERAGVYAPGGTAAYPSSVLMGVVAAKAAGVPEVVVCSPPGPDGTPPPAVLAAAELAGADRVFAIGGAGAVAAMSYGTPTVPRVDAIVGPGNRWVTEAKRQVAGVLRIDSPAGPSEVLVLADERADPERVAAELIAQAEHDPEASVAVVTWSEPLLPRVRAALEQGTARTARREVVEEALAGRGALLLASDREEALVFANEYAAEHLAVFTENPERDGRSLTTAGTLFLGEAASVVFGDYVTGANHVLPTSGTSRMYSGLSVLDFLRVQTLQSLTPDGAARLAPPVETLAMSEGLPAHAEAARLRRPG